MKKSYPTLLFFNVLSEKMIIFSKRASFLRLENNVKG